MRTINENGLVQIKNWLQSQAKPRGWSEENIGAWASEAEESMRNGNPPMIELKSCDTLSGVTETFTVPPEGVDGNLEMTVEQFKEFCKTAVWIYTQDIQTGDQEIKDGYTDDGDEIVKPQGYGYCSKTGSFGGVKVTFQAEVSWEGTQNRRFKDDYESSRFEGDGYEWEMDGLDLIDDDGDKMRVRDEDTTLYSLSEDGYLGDIGRIDFGELIPEVSVQVVDIEDAKIGELIELTNDNAPNVEFNGAEIGSASSRDAYSRETRWTVYKIFRTDGGTLIGQIIGYSQWQGEDTRYKVQVCSGPRELMSFLGYSDAAKEAYAEAGINATVKVE